MQTMLRIIAQGGSGMAAFVAFIPVPEPYQHGPEVELGCFGEFMDHGTVYGRYRSVYDFAWLGL